MLRVVVREDLSYEMATDLVNDMQRVIEWLDHHFIFDGSPVADPSPCMHTSASGMHTRLSTSVPYV